MALFKDDPEPPRPVQIDPRETAAAQFKYGKKAATFNKQLAESTWQSTPYGSLSYGTLSYEDDPIVADVLKRYPGMKGRYDEKGSVRAQMSHEGLIPTTMMVQELDPAEQRLLDQQRDLKGQYGDVAGQLMGKASGLFSSPVDTSSLGPMPSSAWDFDTSSLGAMPVANEATRQSMIDSILGRYQPQQAQDRSALETQLANQGFVRGSEAWNSAMDQINRRENDFRLATNLQAGGEMRADLAQQLGARSQGLQELLASSNVARANLAQQLGIRQQSLQELLLPRNQTLQELSTFMSGSQPTMPQFKSISAPQVSAPNYAGLVAQNAQMQNQANMAAYNAQMQNQGGGLAGLGSLLGAGAGFMMGGPAGASLGSGLGGGVSTFSGALPGAASGGGWSFA